MAVKTQNTCGKCGWRRKSGNCQNIKSKCCDTYVSISQKACEAFYRSGEKK